MAMAGSSPNPPSPAIASSGTTASSTASAPTLAVTSTTTSPSSASPPSPRSSRPPSPIPSNSSSSLPKSPPSQVTHCQHQPTVGHFHISYRFICDFWRSARNSCTTLSFPYPAASISASSWGLWCSGTEKWFRGKQQKEQEMQRNRYISLIFLSSRPFTGDLLQDVLFPFLDG